MLSQANQAAASLGAAEYSNFALARGVVLIVRDVPQQVRSIPPALNEVGRPLLPAASLKLPLENGGTRIVRVIGNVSGDAMVARIADGPLAPPIDVRIPAEEELPPLNSSLLLNGVEPDGQASFVSALLGPGRRSSIWRTVPSSCGLRVNSSPASRRHPAPPMSWPMSSRISCCWRRWCRPQSASWMPSITSLRAA